MLKIAIKKKREFRPTGPIRRGKKKRKEE